MRDRRNKVVILSASPKVDQECAVSSFLAERAKNALQSNGLDVEIIPVRKAMIHRETESAFDLLQQAGSILMIFPLYFFCLPAMLTRFLQDFVAKYPAANNAANVYALINCGFPEPEINAEAMRVLECFCLQTGRTFLGGVMIGGGGMLIGAANAPFMRPVFEKIDNLFIRMQENMCADEQAIQVIEQAAPKFPRRLYLLGGDFGWRSSARKNHLKQKELFRKPYQRQ